MPIINSNFKPKFPFTNKHISTVYRTLFTNPQTTYKRVRINTKDDDFLDLDFSSVGSKSACLLIHGLEGSSSSKYIVSATIELNKSGYDVIVLNLRGCSGELNKQFYSYHSGETTDLDFVVTYLKKYPYYKISLVGFSLGGNMVLKYAGEQQEKLNSKIQSIVAICPPIDLKGSSLELAKKSNRLYMKRFLKTLLKKAAQKSFTFPEKKIDLKKLNQAKSFKDFDNLFTAPSFGFKNAEDYWKKASSLTLLKNIKTKTYVLTALDDPFLSNSCYPTSIVKEHPYLFLECANFGGHIGFVESMFQDNLWLEKRIVKFLNENHRQA